MRLQLVKWSSLIYESVKIATMPVHSRISQTKGKAMRALGHSCTYCYRGGRLELSRHAAGVLNGRLSSVGSMPLRTKPLRDIALIVGDVHKSRS